MEIKESLEQILNNLNQKEGILASLLVRKDGLFLAFVSNDDSINRNTAVSLATVFNTFEQTAEELKTGSLNYLLIKAENKNIFFIEVSKNIILVSFLDSSAKINDIYKEAVKTTPKIMGVLK